MTRRGLVVEVGPRESIVLTRDGEFRRVALGRELQVGEEVEIPTFRFRPYAMVAGLLLVLIGVAMVQWWGASPLLAYVSLDVNPSLEISVNARWRVMDVQGLNADGEEVAQRIRYRGQTLQKVVAQILDQFPSHDYVLLTVCPATGQELADNVLLILRETVSNLVNQAVPVESFEVTPALREAAQAHGVSAGRLALLLAAHEQGITVEEEDVKHGDLVQALARSGAVSVGELVRETVTGKQWDVPEEGPGRPAWYRPGGSLPTVLDEEPEEPADPPRKPTVPPGQQRREGP